MTSHNQKHLVQALESATNVGSRYENLNWINHKRGVQSLVFQAKDQVTSRLVAIKVINPDHLHIVEKVETFNREPELLEKLEGKNRCLQIVQGLDYYDWELLSHNASTPIPIKCGYFVTEWLEEDVDEYFLNQHKLDTADKLMIFRDTILAVEAIHRNDIVHRDLKIDNIRLKVIGEKQIVVIIDFGLSARHGDPKIGAYSDPIGAPWYNPPESFAGFTGERKIAHLQDSYALGCLLFELFNKKYFGYARDCETEFMKVAYSISSSLVSIPKMSEKYKAWDTMASMFHLLKTLPPIDGPGSSLPLSITNIINRLYQQLAAFDFKNRQSDLSRSIRMIDSALLALQNTKKQNIELRRKKLLREQRKKKIDEKQKRLELFLKEKIGGVNRSTLGN